VSHPSDTQARILGNFTRLALCARARELSRFNCGSTIPITLNAVSKVLSFIAAITLFLPLKGTTAQEKVLL
jgi:hypothetical protein